MIIKLKVGRKILEIDENDLILDNGAIYQIITKKHISGFDTVTPRMSKKLFHDLKLCGLIYTNDDLKEAAIRRYDINCVTFWKFNVNKMHELGY